MIKRFTLIFATFLLISVTSFTLQVRATEEWTIEYLGDVLPENATPPWTLAPGDTGYRNTDGDKLTIRTTNEGGRTEVQYNMYGIVSRSGGITVEARVKIGYIGTDGEIPDIALQICDSLQAFSLLFLEDKVFDEFDQNNYYLLDTKDSFHVYRITSKDGATNVYIDGFHRLTLAGISDGTNCVVFGDKRWMPGGMNGESHWDYVKINTNGAFPPLIEATVDIKPESLNLISKGEWITAYIELPEGYDVNDVNVSTITLNDIVPAEQEPICIGDYDIDGIPDLMVKFERANVISYILANVDLTELFEQRFMTITGKLYDGTPFQGKDIIRIILPMP